MSLKAWADAARRDKYNQDAAHQRAIDTFQSLLDGSINPDTAAGMISSLYEPLIKPLCPKVSPVATLWAIFCDAVRALGGNQELTARLIDLLDSISSLPDVTNEYGNAITPSWCRAVYWRDLPEFAVMFREYGIDIEQEGDEMDGDWDEQAGPLLNATTFAAMYLARSKRPTGMWFHAEGSLMDGTEMDYQTPEQQRYAAMWVPPAATWILLAGESIYEFCKSDYNRTDSSSGSKMWGKGTGYSLERWAFWRKRFSDIATTQGLKDDIKDIAARASSEMGKVEGQNQR